MVVAILYLARVVSNGYWGIPHYDVTLSEFPVDKISGFLSSYRVNIARCNLCARAKVKGHIKLKIEENTSVGKLVEPFQIW